MEACLILLFVGNKLAEGALRAFPDPQSHSLHPICHNHETSVALHGLALWRGQLLPLKSLGFEFSSPIDII